MDWNNINTDRDTSGLGPIEYDQSKVPALIRKHADNVRTKTYGQEVREAQARNAELAGLIASEADSKATNADLLSKDTQNRFNEQIAGATNSDEVIDARIPYGGGAYATLGERLNESDDRIADISVNVKDFGADESLEDNTQAFNEASQYCFDNGYTLTANGTFRITGTVVFKGNVNMPNATLEYMGSSTAVELGVRSSKTENLAALLPEIIKVIKEWGVDVGLKIINTYSSNITVPRIQNFGVGLLSTAYGATGTVYNTINIGHLENNKVNNLIELGTTDSWVNENLYIGGRYSHYSNEGMDVAGVSHIKTRGMVGSEYQPNNNLFVKPSIEGHAPYYTLDIHGNNNTIIQGRFEGQGQRRVIYRTIENISSRRNSIINGYNSELLSIEEETGSQWNTLVTPTKNVMSGSGPIPAQTYKNTTSADQPVIRVVDPVSSPFNNSPENFSHQLSASKTEMKRQGDTFSRMVLEHSTPAIKFGNGTSSPESSIAFNSSVGMIFNDTIMVNDHSWENNLIRLGNYRLWVDSYGKLRIKNGSPLSDTDGTAVGN